MKVEVTELPPPPPSRTVAIEMTGQEASELMSLIGKYQLWDVSPAMDNLWGSLWNAGIKSDPKMNVIAGTNLVKLYGNKST